MVHIFFFFLEMFRYFSMCFCFKILLLIKRRNSIRKSSGKLRVGSCLDSLFRSLGGQRRRPGANYRKKFGHAVVFFTVYWLLFLVARCRVQAQLLARVWCHLSWQKFLNPSQKNPARLRRASLYQISDNRLLNACEGLTQLQGADAVFLWKILCWSKSDCSVEF